jgi:hypothetical protein
MKRVLVCCVLFAGCSYPYDQLYEPTTARPDASIDVGANALLASWSDRLPLTEDCVRCAEEQCAQEHQACMNDAQCSMFTACVGQDPSPAGISTCRARFSDWVNTLPYVRERDWGGPYGQCVFRIKCASTCTADSELWCRERYAWPTTPAKEVPLSLYLVDAYDNLTPVANATVRACEAQNPRECTNNAAAASVGSTNADGLVELSLPVAYSYGFSGYLEITGGDRLPTLLKFSWRLGEPTTQVVAVVAASFYEAATVSLGTTPERTLGMLQLRMQGCQGGGVKGVHFALKNPDPRTRTWYLEDIATLDADMTGPLGQGGIIDVQPGLVDVRALTADETVIANVDAPVRPGFMTVVVFVPQSS